MSSSENDRDKPQRVIREFQARKRTLPRWECPEATYHVRASICRGRPERLVQPDIARIVTASLHHDDGIRYLLHCYVLMPDHFHAVLHALRRDDGFVPLSEIMQGIKSSTAHRINKLTGRTGSFWLAEGYTRIIRCAEEYRLTYHYIRCNPIAAGFVELPEEWDWWWERKA
ncbi:MAG: hypothetical protein GX131_20460 [candidate division WS1 bacterium]|jgi:REP element-mobilizing transposase RayT|nr:hypothetical protein [candidate division WS1 bacterium]